MAVKMDRERESIWLYDMAMNVSDRTRDMLISPARLGVLPMILARMADWLEPYCAAGPAGAPGL